MDTDCTNKDIHFVDYSELTDDLARELFQVIFPDHQYGKAECPWREWSRTNVFETASPKKLSLTSSFNSRTELQSPNTVQPEPYSEAAVPVCTTQAYSAAPQLDLPTKTQLPPPFLPRNLPHNVPQQQQQHYAQPMTFYSRPPFPITTTYPIPGQEMLTLQTQNYTEAMYDMQHDNEPQPDHHHHHHHHQQQQHHHHQKYRADKQTGYPLRKQNNKKQLYYDPTYPEEIYMDPSVEAMTGQTLQASPVVPYTNLYTSGIPAPGGYSMQYMPYVYTPGYIQQPSYIPQPGALTSLLDVSQTPSEVVPFEPPIVMPAVPVPVAHIAVSEPQIEPQDDNCILEEVVTSEPEVAASQGIVLDLNQVGEERDETADLEQQMENVDSSEAVYESSDDAQETVENNVASSEDTSLYQSSASTTPEKPSQAALPTQVAEAEPMAPVVPAAAPSVAGGAWGSGKSWAGLFKSQSCPVPDPVPTLVTETDDDISNQDQSVEDDGETDCLQQKLGKYVQRLKLDFTMRAFQPRGLINRSNWCYINATLQALLVCPALYNLLKQLQEVVFQRARSCTPIMDSLVELVSEFTPMASVSTRKEDLSIGPPLEPVCIHKMLSLIKSECVKGRQEDAEEFLSCILNGLHEEMVSLTKATTALKNGTCNGVLETNGRMDASEEEDEEDDWKIMGAKNKGMVTRSDQLSQSLVKDLFGGQTRSVLTAGTEHSAVLQPFFTLQLDIQTNGESVSESLSQLTIKEVIQGYQCPRSKREVEASRRTTLEELPPVLILHFKRFVYDDKDGGSKKVLKRTDYPLDLELKTDLLSPEVKKKYTAKQSRSYKLFAVVYHDGKEAVKGHYIADIFYPGSGSWLRCDDRNIAPTTEAQVLAFNSPCVPYLLFYSRTDLQQQQASK